MQTQPPYMVNYGGPAGRYQLVPQALWTQFCSFSDAQLMLSAAREIDPSAVCLDILDEHTPLPPGVARFPVPINATQVTDISVYVIFGNVPMKGEGITPATLYEFAGWLSDTKNGLYDPLDAQATNIQSNVNNKSRLYAYVSPFDPADSDCYWADGPVLGGMAK